MKLIIKPHPCDVWLPKFAWFPVFFRATDGTNIVLFLERYEIRHRDLGNLVDVRHKGEMLAANVPVGE